MECTHATPVLPRGHAACSYPARVITAPLPSPTSPSPTPVGRATVPTTRSGTPRAAPERALTCATTTAPTLVPTWRMVDDPNAISPIADRQPPVDRDEERRAADGAVGGPLDVDPFDGELGARGHGDVVDPSMLETLDQLGQRHETAWTVARRPVDDGLVGVAEESRRGVEVRQARAEDGGRTQRRHGQHRSQEGRGHGCRGGAAPALERVAHADQHGRRRAGGTQAARPRPKSGATGVVRPGTRGAD